MYKQLRAGAESGIDFSNRWFADGKTILTIQTTNMIAVDFNVLLIQPGTCHCKSPVNERR